MSFIYQRRALLTAHEILLLVSLARAISLLGDSSLYIILPTQYALAGITLDQVGLMLSANRMIRILLNVPLGLLIERIPRRWMLIPSMGIGVISVLLYTVGGFWSLLIGRLMWGAAWAGLTLSATTVVLDVASDEERGSFIGQSNMWFFIGIGASAMMGGLLFEMIGYAGTFYVAAGVMALFALLITLLLPETHRPNSMPDESAEIVQEILTPLKRPTDVSNPALIMTVVLNALNWMVFIGGAISLMPALLEARLGEKVVLLGLFTVHIVVFTGGLTAVNQVISLIAAPLAGHFSDRRNQRWEFVTLALVVGVTSLLMSAFGNGFIVVLSATLAGITTSILTTQLTALVGDYVQTGSGREHQQGRMLGFMNTAGDIGGAVGPLIAFAYIDVVGIETRYAIGAVIVLLFVPFAIYFTRQERPAPQENRI